MSGHCSLPRTRRERDTLSHQRLGHEGCCRRSYHMGTYSVGSLSGSRQSGQITPVKVPGMDGAACSAPPGGLSVISAHRAEGGGQRARAVFSQPQNGVPKSLTALCGPTQGAAVNPRSPRWQRTFDQNSLAPLPQVLADLRSTWNQWGMFERFPAFPA
jgi:hypothetical protein